MPCLYIKIHFAFGYVCHFISNRLKIRTFLEFLSGIMIADDSLITVLNHNCNPDRIITLLNCSHA